MKHAVLNLFLMQFGGFVSQLCRLLLNSLVLSGLPLNRVGALNKIGKAYSTLEQEFEREPSPEELATELHMNVDDVSEAMTLSAKPLSMDAPFTSE